ncbi:GerMN domain-containing protein [Agromyces sp. Marseille-P2726]|uniref:GerMN domain-containing protein n=1 Tax=Agromyces sp. Marseille-P2726 TaxID=2709132 RepID=UPI00156DA13F|nr:GerMN domain-containing protein [Agromyces sp. Marseille-P2726]
MRRRVLAASVALVALVLSGCAAIPSSGPVQVGDPVPPAAPPDIDILVPGPVAGQTQSEILNGFINAALSPRNNYQVAREYLTAAFRDEWQADEGATIDVLADREVQAVDDTLMRVSATPAAALGPNGQYEEPDSSTPIPLEYRFEQVDGEWRISSAPPGILIDQVGFTQVFDDYTVYFFDPAFRYLVPDVRWYAVREAAQTSIVQAMIAGAADWLAPGVVSAFPEGVTLEPAAVPVSGGVADVSLTGAAFDSLSTVQGMQQQLEASLVGVREIRSVELTLNGVEPDIPSDADPPIRNPRVDPRSVVFDGEAFGHLATTGERIEPIPGLSEQVIALAPSGAAVGPGEESAAVRNAAGVWLARVGEASVLLDPRDDLIDPAVDGEGVVWSVPASLPDQLAWYSPDGATSGQVDVPWSGSEIASLEVSRDSTRMIALLADGGRTHFVAASIQRDENGLPVGLGTMPLTLDDVAGTPLDVTWLDSRTVASLTALPDGTTRIITQELGGFANQRDGPVDAVRIDGGNNDLRALTAEGDFDVRSGVGWQVRASGIRLLATQQAR